MTKLSLKYRIALIIFLLEALMITLVLWQTGAKFSSEIQANIHSKERVIIHLLSDLSRVALINGDYGELQPYLTKIARDPFITNIVVRNYRNKIVSATNPKLLGQDTFSPADNDKNYWLTEKISNPAGLLGSLAVEYSTASLNQALSNTRNHGLVIALISMAFIAFFGIISGVLVTRRINNLALATREIADGNPDISFDLTGTDEIAGLAQDIQRMSVAINSQIEQLEESEARYHSIFNNSMSVMLVIDPDTGDIVAANQAACQFYGYSYDELTLKKILAINQLSNEEVRQKMAQAAQGQTAPFIFHHKLKDGTIRTVEVYSCAITIAGKKRLLSIVHDISERQQIEEKQQKQLATMQLAQEITRLGYYEINWLTDTGYRSDGLLAILGDAPDNHQCSREQLIQYIHAQDREYFTSHLEQSLVNQTSVDIECRLVDSHGEILTVHCLAQHFFDENGVPQSTVGVFQDISAREQEVEELRQHREDLEKLVDERTTGLRRIIGTMAGRELRMAEMKEQVKRLQDQLAEAGLQPAPPRPATEKE